MELSRAARILLDMSLEIAIVGGGATALYCLKHLFTQGAFSSPIAVTLFESGLHFGKGMPYDEALNADYMLCNAFSREIPPVTETLLQYLKGLPPRELTAWELSEHDLSARAFYPRVLIGEYLHSEFERLCNAAEQLGHRVTLKPDTRVTDVLNRAQGATVVSDAGDAWTFDKIILATGHVWPRQPTIGQAKLLSPWPYTNITSLPATNIGILGSSLSAIDIAMALAFTHGTFEEQDGALSWRGNADAADLKITMISKMGVMPEGDFYYPFPYQPLKILSPEAVAAEVRRGGDGLLERLFRLLHEELKASDPDYIASLGASAGTLEGFSTAYFKARRELGGLDAVKRDFRKTRASMRERRTIPYRYALLRAHENFDLALRALTPRDWDRFQSSLLPVFTDCYAAVPHLSLARIIALHDAGVLEIRESGDDAEFRTSAQGGITVAAGDDTFHFDAMIDARGQAPAALAKLPFPGLVRSLKDDTAPLAEPFRLELSTGPSNVYCLSMPQLLERHPFSQGLAEAEKHARVVVGDIASSDV